VPCPSDREILQTSIILSPPFLLLVEIVAPHQELTVNGDQHQDKPSFACDLLRNSASEEVMRCRKRCLDDEQETVVLPSVSMTFSQ
jgi:hypothetical protein